MKHLSELWTVQHSRECGQDCNTDALSYGTDEDGKHFVYYIHETDGYDEDGEFCGHGAWFQVVEEFDSEADAIAAIAKAEGRVS